MIFDPHRTFEDPGEDQAEAYAVLGLNQEATKLRCGNGSF